MTRKYYQITSLERGIKVLELLAEQKALTVSEVGVHLSMQRSAAHRFLATLRDLGYVEKNEDNRYQLTFRILEMGEKVARRFGDLYTTPNYTSGSSFCFYAALMARNLTLGFNAVRPDLDNTNCVLLWGKGPDHSAQ